jgi:type II secretory pathway pseudopilin PulG
MNYERYKADMLSKLGRLANSAEEKTLRVAASNTGFMLLEVMVSVAILGIGILMVMQLFSGGLLFAGAAKEHTTSVLLAKEKMAWALTDKAIETGVRRGAEPSGFLWKVKLSPYDNGVTKGNPELKIMKVDVSINRPGRSSDFILTSLKSMRVDQ